MIFFKCRYFSHYVTLIANIDLNLAASDLEFYLFHFYFSC